MKREKVISREYKLVLNSENFTGNEPDLIKKAHIFWENFKKITRPVIKTAKGKLAAINIKREIRFYDTKDFMLYHKDYIFRERKNLSNGKKEVTLKYRHPDRYVSQDRDMKAGKAGKDEIKFEEDIKAPFLKLYSFSASQAITGKQEFKKIKDIVKLYPGFAEQPDKLQEEEKIVLVNDLVIREIVITGSEITICDDPLLTAECALIIWYGLDAFADAPLIVEFSFRYGNKKERYSGKAAQKTYDLFMLMQEGMKSWIDSEDATKTGFVYGNK